MCKGEYYIFRRLKFRKRLNSAGSSRISVMNNTPSKNDEEDVEIGKTKKDEDDEDDDVQPDEGKPSDENIVEMKHVKPKEKHSPMVIKNDPSQAQKGPQEVNKKDATSKSGILPIPKPVSASPSAAPAAAAPNALDPLKTAREPTTDEDTKEDKTMDDRSSKSKSETTDKSDEQMSALKRKDDLMPIKKSKEKKKEKEKKRVKKSREKKDSKKKKEHKLLYTMKTTGTISVEEGATAGSPTSKTGSSEPVDGGKKDKDKSTYETGTHDETEDEDPLRTAILKEKDNPMKNEQALKRALKMARQKFEADKRRRCKSEPKKVKTRKKFSFRREKKDKDKEKRKSRSKSSKNKDKRRVKSNTERRRRSKGEKVLAKLIKAEEKKKAKEAKSRESKSKSKGKIKTKEKEQQSMPSKGKKSSDSPAPIKLKKARSTRN